MVFPRVSAASSLIKSISQAIAAPRGEAKTTLFNDWPYILYCLRQKHYILFIQDILKTLLLLLNQLRLSLNSTSGSKVISQRPLAARQRGKSAFCF